MMKELNDWMNSKTYQGALLEIVKSTHIELYPSIPHPLWELAEKQLRGAVLSLEEAASFLESDGPGVIQFSVAKIKAGRNLRTEQEYPSGEKPGKDRDRIVETRVMP